MQNGAAKLGGRLVEALFPWAAGNGASTAPAEPEKKSIIGSTGVSFVGSPDFRHVIQILGGEQPNPDAERLERNLALVTSAYCFTAAQFRATRVAEPPLMVVREDDDGEVWDPAHELAPLLDQPRPDLEMGELLTRTQLYRDITGGALWVLERDNGQRIARITPYHADEYRSSVADGLIYGRYEIKRRGRWTDIDRELVIEFRETTSLAWRGGPSRVDVALAHLDLGHQVNRIVRRYIQKALFPGGIISPDPKWDPSPADWEAFKQAVTAWYGGPANAGAPLAVKGGTTVTKVSSGLQDLLPKDILDRVETVVGSVFGVAPVLLGWMVGLTNSPWSQMEEARRATYQDTIEPLWREFERRAGRVLLRPEERAAGVLLRFDMTNVRALQPDEERRARIQQANAGVWTVGERRKFTGRDLLPKNDPRNDAIPELDNVGPSLDLIGLGMTGPDDAKADEADLAWLVFDLEAKAGERRWEGVIGAELRALREAVLKSARQHLEDEKSETKAASRDAVTEWQFVLTQILDEAKPELASKVYPLIRSNGGRAVQRLARRLDLSFTVLEPGLLKFATEEAAFLAEVMGETTGRAVAAAVQSGLNNGETVRQLVKRLEELPAFNRDRARLVARTETTRAWNGAQRRSMSTYAQTLPRERVVKIWLSSRDARVREEHADLDGERVGIDEPFSNGLQQPGESNCRCTLIYRIFDPLLEDETEIREGQS